MEEKRLIDADDLLIAFGNALNNATLKIGYGFMHYNLDLKAAEEKTE